MALPPARLHLVKNLLLVPTHLELTLVHEFLPTWNVSSGHADGEPDFPDIVVQVCGFGLVAAAAQSARLITQFAPQRIWLLGIAGSYRNAADIGQAMCFRQVVCHGIGVGSGDQFQSVERLGWMHWTGNQHGEAIGDRIGLAGTPIENSAELAEWQHTLLSVAAASQDANDVGLRKKFCPEAIAEDMEGFAVAVASRLEQLPLTIIRGISNVAGDRNKANWKVRPAMQSAVKLFHQLLLQSEFD